VALPESLRDPVGRDESYLLRRTELDRALSDAGVSDVSRVYFLRWGIEEWRQSGKGRVVTVNFAAATTHSPERLEIRLHAAPSVMAREVRVAAEYALGTAADWVAKAQKADNVWRSHDHELVVAWDGQRLTQTSS
jgi:hypothetical protein